MLLIVKERGTECLRLVMLVFAIQRRRRIILRIGENSDDTQDVCLSCRLKRRPGSQRIVPTPLNMTTPMPPKPKAPLLLQA